MGKGPMRRVCAYFSEVFGVPEEALQCEAVTGPVPLPRSEQDLVANCARSVNRTEPVAARLHLNEPVLLAQACFRINYIAAKKRWDD